MELVYIALFAIWSYLCYYIGKRLEKAKQDEKRINDSKIADSIIRKAEKEFEEKYKKSLHRK